MDQYGSVLSQFQNIDSDEDGNISPKKKNDLDGPVGN